MPNLEAITLIVNAALKAGNFASMKFQRGRFLGIADDQRTRVESGEYVRPGIIDNDGQVTNIALDDKYPYTIYHKIDALAYELDDYGKPGDFLRETASMRMVFLGDQRKVKTRPEEMAAFAVLNIPREFTSAQYAPLNLTSAVIQVDEANMNKYEVWTKEFENVPESLKPFSIVFAIPYRIVTTFNKKCYTDC